MARGPSRSAILSLSDAGLSTEQKVQVAKQLKTIIVGHDQRKGIAVRYGIIQPLADILSFATKSTGKRRQEVHGRFLQHPQEPTVDDDLRLQAALILGSLAAAGPSCLQPLCAAGVPKILVEVLSADIGPRLVTAVLQALESLASFWAASNESSLDFDLWRVIFDGDSLEVFDSLLRQPTSTLFGRQQVKLVADIISALPDRDYVPGGPKARLTNCGVLDTLASLLASHAAETKIVWYHGDLSHLPPPPPQVCLPSILTAISTVISGSNYRAHRFILAPSIRDLFHRSSADSSDTRACFGPRSGFANPHTSLLPPLYIPAYRTVSHTPSSNSFPALKTLQSTKSSSNANDSAQLVGDIDHSNAVCGWLTVLARSLHGIDRLTAIRLLALVASAADADPAGSVHRSEFTQKTVERQKQLALLAVPLAVRLVQTASESKGSDLPDQQRESQNIQEEACEILALLIGGNKDLQVAAVEAKAIQYVCVLLKKSFDNITPARSMWTAKPMPQSETDVPRSCQTGKLTFSRELSHAMRCREGALKAIAALAAKEDLHRKAIIDSGVVSTIIDSLKPFPVDDASSQGSHAQLGPKDGNTTAVILAACRAAQSMSRSVSVLRTSLIDGGIAKPLIQLLDHASLEVQIAATDVCCNLLPEFSPMREDLSDGKVVKTLVAHAKSSSPALRLSSLWALKHMMHSCPKEVKLHTLEELGTGWLVGIIQGEQRESGLLPSGGGVSVGLSTPNAAGEQVDILNPSSMDVDDPGMLHEEAMDEDDEDGEVMYDEASSTHYQSSQLRSTLAQSAPPFNSKRYLSSIREMEQNDEYTSRRDEAGIQVQALDFLRNFVSGEDCATLADHLMHSIGANTIYRLLTDKLKPVSTATPGGKQVYSPTELVLSTIHVIIHLANASSTHRQMLIAQKSLLQALLPHFNHLDHRVRVMSVWAVNSLTWIEEDGDRRDARQRSMELKMLGIEQAVRALANDPNLDVRERVRTACRQFDTL